MVNPAEIRALLLTRNQETVAILTSLFREIGITVQSHMQGAETARGLESGRFEALVLDFDNVDNTGALIESLRESPSSKSALVFAVASNGSARQRALEQGANFVFERPFNKAVIKEVLQTAYGLMLRDRRRYFRHPVSLPVRLKRITGTELACTSLNISRNGMALQIPSALDLGEEVELMFNLPDSEPLVGGQGTVVWDDKHGKAGLSFQCTTLEDQNRLVKWLDAQFNEQLSSSRTSR